MAAPSRSVAVLDGQLGALGPATASNLFIIGTSTLGVANTIATFGGSNVQAAKTTLGAGAGVDAVAHVLLRSEGKANVFYVEGAKSTAGSASAVTASGGGPTVTLTGTPNDDYLTVIKITVGGVLGTSAFQYSLDGGKNFSPTFLTAATFALPSGVTANFAAGTYVATETYSWTDTGPKNTNADIGAALDVVLASSLRGIGVYVVGFAADQADAEAIATTIGSKLNSGLASQIFMRGFTEMPPIDKAGLISGFADFEDSRVIGYLGFADVVNDVTNGRVDKRSVGRSLMARVMRNGLSTDAQRNITDSDVESLSGVTVPDNQAAATGYHLEDQTPGADDGRFATVMKLPPRGGVYPANMKTFAASTSDFQLLQYALIIDEACRVTSDALLTFQSKKLAVDAATGFILEAEARNIEAKLKTRLRAALVQNGHAVAVNVTVNRTDNLLSDNTLRVTISVTPNAYAKAIAAVVGLRNPVIPVTQFAA